MNSTLSGTFDGQQLLQTQIQLPMTSASMSTLPTNLTMTGTLHEPSEPPPLTIDCFQTGNGEFITDIKVTSNGAQEAELLRNGYSQLPSDLGNGAQGGTFGKGKSLWFRRRKQGTCGGRLRPIIDIQFMNLSTSSAMVLNGYICLSESVGGQWLWIKRALTEDEEQDAILHFAVTLGKSKLPSDKIWISPGVGWTRIDGNFNGGSVMEFNRVDAFLWFLPNRARSAESQAISPVRAAFAMGEDTRREKMMFYARMAIRNYLPVPEIGRLTNFQRLPEDPTAIETIPRSQDANALNKLERFSGDIALYKKYDTSGKGHMTKSRLGNMLEDLGVHIESADLNWCFYCFSSDLDKYIGLDEFIQVVSFNDHEIDMAIHTIRKKLLQTLAHVNVSNGVNATNASTGNTLNNRMTKDDAPNRLRDQRTLTKAFSIINSSHSGILSLDELLELVMKMELYLTEEEGRTILKLMDNNSNERVEESEFVDFMKRSGSVRIKKSERVHEAAKKLKLWLQRGVGSVALSGSSPMSSTTPTAMSPTSRTLMDHSASALSLSVTPAQHQWDEIRRRREKATGTRFTGFITSADLMLLLNYLGIRLSATEAKELLLFIVPNRNAWQNGRLEQKDLISFASTPCRMHGQLDLLLSKDFLKPLIDCYREHRDALRSTGVVNEHFAEKYEGTLQEIVDAINSVPDAPNTEFTAQPTNYNVVTTPPTSPTLNTTALASSTTRYGGKDSQKPTNLKDIFSLVQVKQGTEKVMAEYITPGTNLPNLEEWASVACRYGALVVENDVYGVSLPWLFQSICIQLTGELFDFHPNEKVTLDPLVRDLQLMIQEEAKRLAGNGKLPAYNEVFALFDEDHNDKISTTEFKNTLSRWKLLGNMSESQVTSLIATFDQQQKGFIDYADFLRFLQVDKFAEEISEYQHFEDEEDENQFGMSSNTPPTAITRNNDCDWLLWMLWKEASRIDSVDPESVITEMEATCNTMTVNTNNSGTIKMIDLWKVLIEFKMKGNLTKAQFAKCVLYLVDETRVLDGKQIADDLDLIDYDALCRYTVRMGRSYTNLVHDRQTTDDKLYSQLFPQLKKELSLMIPVSDSNFGTTMNNSPTKRHLKQPTLNAKTSSDIPKFQQILRRVDQDNDGRVTRAEFKLALKKLGCQNENQWNVRLVQRFFDEVEPSSGMTGYLTILRLTQYIKNCVNYSDSVDMQQMLDTGISDFNQFDRTSNPTNGATLTGTRKPPLSLDRSVSRDFSSLVGIADDFNIGANNSNNNNITNNFSNNDTTSNRRRKPGDDHRLWKKIATCLQDSIDSLEPGELMEDAVRGKIRKSFQKWDPKQKGLVTEERFISFIQQSGLQDELTTQEINRVLDQLNRTVNGATMIDYEKFCTDISMPREGLIRGKSENLLRRLAEAAHKSAQQGRTFLSLCALVDSKNSGYMAADELIITAKMMEMSLNKVDVETITDAIPMITSSRQANSLDYKMLNTLLQHHTDTNKVSQVQFDVGTATSTLRMPDRSLFSSPFDDPPMSPSTYRSGGGGGGNNSNDISRISNGSSNANNNSNANESVISFIADRIQQIVKQKTMTFGSYSLAKQFEKQDRMLTGTLPLHRFQVILEDIGVDLKSFEVRAIAAMFGQGDVEERIDYEMFCRGMLEVYGSPVNNSFLPSTPSSPSMSKMKNDFSVFNKDTSFTSPTTSPLPPSSSSSTSFSSALKQNPRIMNRVRVLRRSGLDLLRVFSEYDNDQSGLIQVRHFRDVIQQFMILSSEHQLQIAINEFGSIHNKSLICYEDFCFALEGNLSSSSVNDNSSVGNRISLPNVVDGSGYDGMRKQQQQQQQQESMLYDMERRRPEEETNYRSATKTDKLRKQQPQWPPEDLYDSPKISDSVSFHRTGLTKSTVSDKSGSPTRPIKNPYDFVNVRDSGTLSRSSVGSFNTGSNFNKSSMPTLKYHVPPSKIGTMMWGNGVNNKQKGKPPVVVDEDNVERCWCCAVCLYMENPLQQPNCLVCDSPNYHIRKEYQVKEQCLNCSFENHQFANNCEMCGQPMMPSVTSSGRREKIAIPLSANTFSTTRHNNSSNNNNNNIGSSNKRPTSMRW